MMFSQDVINKIEYYASLYIKISDMAVMLDIPADVLRDAIDIKSSPVSKAYFRGKAKSKVEIHEKVMVLSKLGSPLALDNAHKNLLDMEDDE